MKEPQKDDAGRATSFSWGNEANNRQLTHLHFLFKQCNQLKYDVALPFLVVGRNDYCQFRELC